MANSNRFVGAAILLAATTVHAQPAAQGFAVERAYPSAASAGWLVMDDLNIADGLGGALGLTVSYERNPLHVSEGMDSLDVVSDRAFANVGGAITYAHWRFYLDFDTVFAESGQSGIVGGYDYTAPSITPSSHPDTIEDTRVGVDVLVLGRPGDPLRVGAGAQLYAPNDSRENYATDRTFRGMTRALVAGDVGRFTYAGMLGAHIRPLDDSSVPGTPHGNELLFGIAAGARFPVACGTWTAVIGPEIFGATAFRSMFDSDSTAIEGLLSGRIEQTTGDGGGVRLKLGIGRGIVHDFGAAEWRVLAGIEIFGQARPTPAMHRHARALVEEHHALSWVDPARPRRVHPRELPVGLTQVAGHTNHPMCVRELVRCVTTGRDCALRGDPDVACEVGRDHVRPGRSTAGRRLY